ncbi:hypothetical protein SELMODRAFT_425177 [Selaginella moellendorffii]|uniref:PHD-type domain-containing protein n=1 Tax=Selaginella moellendorffii TaxID=88036 RepID=D8SS92_SELML|nr:hypothetical protein SELMODRAFT_425177 [Selaginella moellendorffii]
MQEFRDAKAVVEAVLKMGDCGLSRREKLSWDSARVKVLDLFDNETAGTIIDALLQLTESTRLDYFLPADAATKSALLSLVSRKRRRVDPFGEVKAQASALALSLETSYQEMTEEKLGSIDTRIDLLAPDILTEDATSFSYMGRKTTVDILKFFQAVKKGPSVYSTNPNLAIRFITGTPGAGKTYSVAAAAGYLYASERRKATGAAAVAYINARVFMEDPSYNLWRALILAYARDEAALNALKCVDYERPDSLLQFLKERKKLQKVYLLFDDGNSLHDKAIFSGQIRFAARSFVESLAQVCVVVFCASIESKLRKELIKDAAPPQLIVCGGYTRKELVACIGMYLETTDQRLIDGEIAYTLQRTGSVPQLIYHHYFGEDGELDSAISRLKDEIADFILNRSSWEVSELARALRGEQVARLTVAMDTRAFYRGRDGRGKCLTGELRSYAFGLISEKVKAESLEEGKVEVRRWLGMIMKDNNLVRIGWNVEEATILTLKLLTPCIRVDNNDLSEKILIKPAGVRTVKGKFGIDELKDVGLSPTLFLPNFNHIGADVFYSDEEWLVVFQITVANNPEKHHKRTLEVADELFAVTQRRTMLVWVVYTPTETDTWVVKDWEHPHVTQVFMSFGQLSSHLKDIDSALRVLKSNRYSKKPAEDVCPECKCAETCRDDKWISCTYCNVWFHWLCTTATEETWELWLCDNCRAPDDDPDVELPPPVPDAGRRRGISF